MEIASPGYWPRCDGVVLSHGEPFNTVVVDVRVCEDRVSGGVQAEMD